MAVSADRLLQQVVGHHIAQCPSFLIKTGAIFHSDGFRSRYLDILYIVTIPDRLEDRIAEAKSQNVLYRLLAQIMVDSINATLRKRLKYRLVQLNALSRSWPKGFSKTMRDQPLPFWLSPAAPKPSIMG